MSAMCVHDLHSVMDRGMKRKLKEDTMSTMGVHDFHFVMDRRMKNKLKELDFIKNSGSLSGILVKILHVLTPAFRKHHKWGKQQLSRYRFVCDDKEEIRDHVHMYIPGELYRELKLLHQDLNFYSIAQFVRGVIIFFLALVSVYEGEVFHILEKMFAYWKSEDEQARQTPLEFVLQLWKILCHLPENFRLVTIYDSSFSPFWVLQI